MIVGVREVRFGGSGWVAQLHVSPRDEGWEGAIHFHGEDPSVSAVRTGGVFRERGVESIRERFEALDSTTVVAFLRSALP